MSAGMVKRRLRNAGLPTLLSHHSYRVTTITDLLEQGVPLEAVQRLAGHATRAPPAFTIAGRKRSPEISLSGFRFDIIRRNGVIGRSDILTLKAPESPLRLTPPA